MAKFLFSLGLIFFGLGLGKLIQVLFQKEIVKLPLPLGKIRITLQKVALLLLNPITIIGSIWIIKIDNPKIAALPILGAFSIFFGGFLAVVVSKWLRQQRKQAGSFFVCGAFPNVGSLGGLVCYVFLGETGFALVPFYTLLVPLTEYTVGFPVAKLYGAGLQERRRFLTQLKNLATDPFILVSIASTLMGCVINMTGVQRPFMFKAINQILIPLAATLLLIAAGLTMKFSSFWRYTKECMAVASIKFLMIPMTITLIGVFLGYGEILEGLPLKVLIILSSMPVGFLALVPPAIYDLDVDLANSCWLFTTALLVIVLPELYLMVNLW
jgi:predicted permease